MMCFVISSTTGSGDVAIVALLMKVLQRLMKDLGAFVSGALLVYSLLDTVKQLSRTYLMANNNGRGIAALDKVMQAAKGDSEGGR